MKDIYTLVYVCVCVCVCKCMCVCGYVGAESNVSEMGCIGAFIKDRAHWMGVGTTPHCNTL